MPPLPKKKHSRKRQGGRSAHSALRPMPIARCPQCRGARLPHRACPTCGYYRGRAVLPIRAAGQ